MKDEESEQSDRAGDAPLPRETLALFGHDEAESTLLQACQKGRLAHAWIIGGPEGIGKATLAWRFARFLLAHPDFSAPAVQRAASLELPADHPLARRVARGGHGNVFLLRRELNEKGKMRTEIAVDSVRKVIEFFQLSAAEGGWRICIVDSAEDLNKNSANALLKLIEEPPAQSIFLIISQKPGQILPTIRSRCRQLMLHALGESHLLAAVAALPVKHDPAVLRRALPRADGSVRELLRLVDPKTQKFDQKLSAALERLPQVDWREVHSLADAVAGRTGDAAYDALVRGVFAHIDRWLQAGVASGIPVGQLARLAEAWEKLRDSIREAEALNLDRRALVLGMFGDLAGAG